MKKFAFILSLVMVLGLTTLSSANNNGGGNYGTVNVAQGKAITALTNTVLGSPANVTDGDINSSWYSYQGSPSQNSFTLDLQNTYSMGKIVVYPLQAWRVIVSTSTDNVNWTERYKTNWPPATTINGPIAITADGTYSARYVKFFADANWPQYVGIVEMEVYEWLASPPPPPPPSAYGTTNLALGRPVLNSFGVIVPSNPPEKAVDGDADTSWRSSTEWIDSTGRHHEYGAIRIELDKAYKIGKITVNPENVQWYFIAMSELPGDTVPGISSPWVPASSPWVFASYPGLFGTTAMSTEPSTFFLDGTVTARYIWLYIQADTGLTYVQPGVSEIQVYEWGSAGPVANAGADQTVHTGNLVTLDGSKSSDPDEDYPLTYLWRIVLAPYGSTATLTDPDKVYPSFTPDMPGDYTIELVVTDNKGLPSEPDTVLVSTYNTPPLADAGPDQALTAIGTMVQLDGSSSYDLDGDQITYLWTITTRPAGSAATLSDWTSATPTFKADKYGDYIISLVVTDSIGAASNEDTVTVSFSNVKPVANAGENQSVSVGTIVTLDGNGSSDANGDTLTYQWSIVSKPDLSNAVLINPTLVQTSFKADKPGNYIISLVVNDGLLDSDPSNVTVIATVSKNQVIDILNSLMDTINDLDAGVFKNSNMRNALTNKISAELQLIDQGLYAEALDKLENDILQKTNGCAENGAPDKNDWITDCSDQQKVYPLIVQTIELLRNLL